MPVSTPRDVDAAPVPPLKILLIEDDDGDARRIKDLLVDGVVGPIALTHARTLDAGLRYLAREPVSVILLDLHLPDSAGLATFTQTKASAGRAAIVLLISQHDERLAIVAVRQGAQEYVIKGKADSWQLDRAIGHAIERQRIDEELRANERSYRGLVENSIQGILIHANGVVRLANRALARLLGYDWTNELVGTSIWPHIAPDDRDLVARHMSARMRGEAAPSRYEFRVVRRDAAIIWFDCLVTTIVWEGELAILATMVDVTEKHALEEQSRQAQKLEAVARLAAGVAHDFNNLLTVITASSDFLIQDLGDAARCRDHVDEIRKATDAAATLTRQLRAVSQRQLLEPKVLVLNDVVREAEHAIEPLLGETIELIVSLDHGISRVHADAGQFIQVLVNLALNARDAMPAGGFLTIETADVEIDDDAVLSTAPAVRGRYVMLTVSDTGVGMDEQTKVRAFEPFFTTKARGVASGLGLSIAYGIVTQSGGFMSVHSEPGQGTMFKIYLPAVDDRSPSEISAQADQESLVSRTVLIVDDDAAVRARARKGLERKGYYVIEAANGHTAKFLAAQRSDPIDLLLTDVDMPGISGRLLAAQLQTAMPHLKVLYMSGYTDDAAVQRSLVARGAAYLQKPFTPDALLRRVREILDSS